jgi:hypothetical protein
MKTSKFTFVAALASASIYCPLRCDAQKPVSQDVTHARDFRFIGVMSVKPGDKRAYVLLGSGFIRSLRFGDPAKFVSGWLAEHPDATVTPVSRMVSTNTKSGERFELVYVWIEEGSRSLNLDLVRAGMFAAGAMRDMVDNQTVLSALLKDPKLADVQAELEKERAASPQDRVDRLMPETDYKERMVRIQEAEKEARAEKLGIWSDGMQAERQLEGYP